jgi:F5/8 type C domain/Fibronectin type III domain
MSAKGMALRLIMGVLEAVIAVQAAAVTLEWDPSPEPEVAGYKLRYGPTDTPDPGARTVVVDVGLVTQYTLDGLVEGVEYVFAVQAYAADGRMSDFSNEIRFRVPAAELVPSFPVAAVDSEETVQEDGSGRNALDGNPATLWHTAWSVEVPPSHPHHIILDLGTVRTVYGVRYLPRQDGSLNGTIVGYELYVSLDGVTWDAPWITGIWAPTATEKVLLENSSPRGRYVKLVATAAANRKPWTSAAEIQIIVGLP